MEVARIMDKPVKPTFNFVNLSHPNELKDGETRLRIRRLAMSEVGRARRKPKTKRERNEIVFRLRGAPAVPTIEWLGGGEVDPFAPYPIDLDETSRALVATIFRANSGHSRQLRGSWYVVGLSAKSAFYSVLANARMYQLKALTGTYAQQDDSLSLVIQNKALRSMTEQMRDPKHHASDEMLGSVCALMCHHYILGMFAGWEAHRDALMRMIELRGGIENITNEALRITISWTDLTGSFSQDIPSLIPLPRRWQTYTSSSPDAPRPCSNIALLWKQRFPTRLEWITVFDDLNQLIALDRGFTEEERYLAETTGCWVEPTMVRLLAVRPLAHSDDAGSVMEEVCRLGTLLFLAPLWRWIGTGPVWTSYLTRSLLFTLRNEVVEWCELKPLLVWSVYFAALETRDPQEKSQFAFVLAVLMSRMQLKSWDELMGVVKSVLWEEHVFAGSEEVVREEVLRTLRLPRGSVIGD